MKTMQDTMIELCKNIQGAVLGYTQSDEITVVVIDYQTLESDGWFNYRVEKMCSIGASMASRFSTSFSSRMYKEYMIRSVRQAPQSCYLMKIWRLMNDMQSDFSWQTLTVVRLMFLRKMFVIVFCGDRKMLRKIQSLAQSLYSHSELKCLSNRDLQNKMFTEKGINWID